MVWSMVFLHVVAVLVHQIDVFCWIVCWIINWFVGISVDVHVWLLDSVLAYHEFWIVKGSHSLLPTNLFWKSMNSLLELLMIAVSHSCVFMT